jgi:hypothetical protein
MSETIENILNKNDEKIESNIIDDVKEVKVKPSKSKYTFDRMDKDAVKPKPEEGYMWKY